MGLALITANLLDVHDENVFNAQSYRSAYLKKVSTLASIQTPISKKLIDMMKYGLFNPDYALDFVVRAINGC